MEMFDTGVSTASVEPGVLELLARAASTVHGPCPVEEKLDWVVNTVRTMTGASVVAYLDLRGGVMPGATASGDSAADVDRFARPAVRSLLDSGSVPPGVRRGEDLLSDPRYLSFVHRAGLGDDAPSLFVPVMGADGLPHGALLVAGRRGAGTAFEAEPEAAVVALASHLGVALDNLETVTRLTELQAAHRQVVHQLQEAVRPPMPSVGGVELGVHFCPPIRERPPGWPSARPGGLGIGSGATGERAGCRHRLGRLDEPVGVEDDGVATGRGRDRRRW